MPARPIDLAKYAGADLADARNDSSISVEDATALVCADGVEIQYGEIIIAVQRSVMEDIRRYARLIPTSERPMVMASTDRALRAAVGKVLKGMVSKKRMDTFYYDLMLWTALMELAQ